MLYALEVIISAQPEFIYYGDKEEKSFSHIAMVVKFPDDNKLKTSLKKVNLHCFKLHRSYTVSFNLSNVGEIFWG